MPMATTLLKGSFGDKAKYNLTQALSLVSTCKLHLGYPFFANELDLEL